ncbi:hypothetical protein V5799_008708, partial [Amblyomma americanum]
MPSARRRAPEDEVFEGREDAEAEGHKQRGHAQQEATSRGACQEGERDHEGRVHGRDGGGRQGRGQLRHQALRDLGAPVKEEVGARGALHQVEHQARGQPPVYGGVVSKSTAVPPPPPPPPQQLPAELQPLQEYGRLLNRLAQSLLASMLDQTPRAHWNVLLSPISLVSTLAALVAGSEGPTQEDLCRLLNLQLPEVEAIIEQFK